MIPLFVNLTILVGLIATVGMAVYSYQRSAETVSLAQRNAARMEQVGYAIRSGLRPALMNGPVLVPLGDPDGPPVAVATQADGKTAANPAEQVCIDGMADYLAGNPSQSFNQTCRRMGVPRWLVSDDRTPWGGRYAFCPYSPDAYGGAPPGLSVTATGMVRDNATTSYRIRTVELRGRAYVLQSDVGTIQASGADAGPTAPTTRTEEIVGFLLSPPPQIRDRTPRCQDVAKVNGAWIVIPSPGGSAEGSYPGSVVPILSRGIGTGQVANQGEVVIYAAGETIGLGTGNDPANAIALKDALDLWHLTPWRSTTFRIKAGSYAFGAADTVPGSSPPIPRLALTTAYPGRSLRLEAIDGPVALAASDGVVDLALGIETTMDSVSLGAGVQLRPMEGSSVRVTNAALHHVRVDGGDLSLGLGTSVASDAAASPYSAVDVISGRLRLSGGTLPITGQPAVGIQLFGGDLVMNGTGLAADLAPGGTTVAPAPNARILVAPAANGSWPSVTATGGGQTVGGTLGGDMVAVASTLPGGPAGCNPATGSCVAACRTPEEANAGMTPLRIAVQGSCIAAEAASPELRASLTTSANGLFAGGDQGSWHCAWRPGDQFMQSPVAGGAVRVDAAPYPFLTATARCAPNPSLTLPLGPQAASNP